MAQRVVSVLLRRYFSSIDLSEVPWGKRENEGGAWFGARVRETEGERYYGGYGEIEVDACHRGGKRSYAGERERAREGDR